ncbi:MarC family protein [Arenibaculum sp.]|jgi:multiple antibiotic resistance protein|uniref:MarC family protein n=1 Tax=Arenibaculum sp. TaxID=2865862 RepID=UPI002E15C9E7|nr:MarC family protein [Arenibaculum sp.]
MIDLVVTSAVALLVTIDPIGIGPVFAALTRGSDPAHRRRMAVKGVLIAALILFVFAFGGDFLLRALGIGFPAFRIAGGILLLLLAVDMVFARPSGLRSTTESEREEATHRQDISVFPVAIPLIAGPGALTTVVLMMGRAGTDPLLAAAVLGVLAAVLAATLAVLLAAGAMTRLLGVTGTNVISRVLGILLAALACQFVIDGLLESGIAG